MTTMPEQPAHPAGELYFKTDVSPEEIFQAIGRLRKEARDEIDRLIRFLDESDDHMELEPEEDDDSEDEPSLASLDRAMDQNHWKGATFVPVYNHDLELDDADDEPLLGSVATHDHLSQDHWAQGNRDDREGDGCADIPEKLLGLFERTAWPVVPAGVAARSAAQGPKVDIGARMRGMWR
jgi:hypothetical protein